MPTNATVCCVLYLYDVNEKFLHGANFCVFRDMPIAKILASES